MSTQHLFSRVPCTIQPLNSWQTLKTLLSPCFCMCIFTCSDLGQSICSRLTLEQPIGSPLWLIKAQTCSMSQCQGFGKLDVLAASAPLASGAWLVVNQPRSCPVGRGSLQQLPWQAALLTSGPDATLPLQSLQGLAGLHCQAPGSVHLRGSFHHTRDTYLLHVCNSPIFTISPSARCCETQQVAIPFILMTVKMFLSNVSLSFIKNI